MADRVHQLIDSAPDAAPAMMDHDGARYSYGAFRAMTGDLAASLADAGVRVGEQPRDGGRVLRGWHDGPVRVRVVPNAAGSSTTAHASVTPGQPIDGWS